MSREKVFVANRGEIAVRIMRSCRHMNLETLWPLCPEDTTSLAADLADTLLPLKGPQDFLSVETMTRLARENGAKFLHPGYGYLSENNAFASAIEKAGIIFLGPREKALKIMGDKLLSRSSMQEAGVPVVPGSGELKQASDFDFSIPFPLLLKPSGGGGGKGMVVVHEKKEFPQAFASCQRLALQAFGDDRVYLEKWIPRARHVEVQIMADAAGHTLALGTRDCSLQRRHQKIIEECPAPGLNEALRQALEETAVTAARSVDYLGAGTVEFILTEEGQFYFLEMNTRLQVEHPVTEMVYGMDLVEWQIRIARGESLKKNYRPQGHALEARIYAEDPQEDFLPCSGDIHFLSLPEGPGLRVDSGVREGSRVDMAFDPLLLKIIAFGENREQARLRLSAALRFFVLHGVGHNGEFLLKILEEEIFKSGNMHTRFIEEWNPEETENLLPHILGLHLYEKCGIRMDEGRERSFSAQKSVFLQKNKFELKERW
jgi:3-methylcrotonyl-CoA carboxylase alpha subunit